MSLLVSADLVHVIEQTEVGGVTNVVSDETRITGMPWATATVTLSTEDKKVNTLEEVVVPFKVTSSAALKSGSFTIDWDESVLQLVGRAVPCAPLTIEATGVFSLRFLAKDQHTITKTQVRLTSAVVTDVHGFVISPTVPVTSTILIHDAHPLVPAEVAIKAGDVSVETRQNFTVPIAVTSTKTLTNLSVNVSWDAAVLEWKGVAGAGGAAGVRALPRDAAGSASLPHRFLLFRILTGGENLH